MQQENPDYHEHLKIIKSVMANIWNILSALATIATILTLSFIWGFFANILNHPGWIGLVVAFAVGGIVAVILLFSFSLIRAARLSRHAPPRWILRSYKYVETESIYTIDEKDPKHHIFEINTTIQATQSGVNVFENTYRWTGRGKEELPRVESQGHVMLGEAVMRGGWRYYYIHLGQPLNKGEKATIKTVQELRDEENRFDPYLAKIISEKVDKLTLHVRLPLHSLPSKITFTVWNSEGPASNPISIKDIENKTGDIVWKINKPVLTYRYEIRWEYEKKKAGQISTENSGHIPTPKE